MVQLLIATDRVEVNSQDQQGQTPLSWAVRGGHKEVVKLLLQLLLPLPLQLLLPLALLLQPFVPLLLLSILLLSVLVQSFFGKTLLFQSLLV